MTGVAGAVYGADIVVRGECVNVFCVTRPPGHHAGRSLHPMKAVSNGFCILNSVACAALHATTPLSEGGLGLSRVCVIDFDVHHGNGTQDIVRSSCEKRCLDTQMISHRVTTIYAITALQYLRPPFLVRIYACGWTRNQRASDRRRS